LNVIICYKKGDQMPKALQTQEIEQILDGVLISFEEIEETAKNLVLGILEQNEYTILTTKQGTLYLREYRRVELLEENRVCRLKKFLEAFMPIVRRKAVEEGVIGLLPMNSKGKDAVVFANLIPAAKIGFNDGYIITSRSSLYCHGRPVIVKTWGKLSAGVLRFADGSKLKLEDLAVGLMWGLALLCVIFAMLFFKAGGTFTLTEQDKEILLYAPFVCALVILAYLPIWWSMSSKKTDAPKPSE
jgi:hypothetical protein